MCCSHPSCLPTSLSLLLALAHKASLCPYLAHSIQGLFAIVAVCVRRTGTAVACARACCGRGPPANHRWWQQRHALAAARLQEGAAAGAASLLAHIFQP